MGWQRRTEITSATRETTVIRQPGATKISAYCYECSGSTVFLKLETAVFASSFKARELVRLAEADKVHFCETTGGQMFICEKSLLNYLHEIGGLR